MATDAAGGREGLLARPRDAISVLIAPRTERQRVRRGIVALCLPFLALLAFSGLFPLIEMVRMSVSEARLTTEGFTLSAYRGLVVDPYYRSIAVNTLAFAVATTVATIVVVVPVAHALANYDPPASRCWSRCSPSPTACRGSSRRS